MTDTPDVIERPDLYREAELPTTRQIAEFVREHGLTRQSATYANLRIALFLVAVPGLFFLGHAVSNPFLWPVIWLAQGALIIATNSGVHEAVHGNLYRSKTANYVAGMGWGAVTMFDFGVYRGLHLQHHAHTHAEGDGEPVNKKMNRLDYVTYMLLSGPVFMCMLLGIGVATTLGRGPSWMDVGNRRSIARINSLVLLVAAGFLAYGFSTAPALTAEIWLAPTLAYYLVFAPMIALAEHQDCAWGPTSVFTTTRMTKSNAAMRFLAWGGNFHAAHHLVPSVPGQRLEPLADFMAPFCSYVAPSYLRWHWSMLTGHGRSTPPPYPG